MKKCIATQLRPFKLMTNINDKKLLNKAKENTIKTKLSTEVFEVCQKVRVSNCIHI